MLRMIVSVMLAGLVGLLAACGSTQPTPDAQNLSLSAQGSTQGIPSTLASAIALDKVNHTVTLPLYRGIGPDGGSVYFVLIDTSDFHQAVRRGTNWSPKLKNALGTPAVQRVKRLSNNWDDKLSSNRSEAVLRFSGNVNFAPKRKVVPGPDLFPLDPSSTAGSVGDARYSPLVTTGDGVVYNTPILANSTGIHDKVLNLDTRKMQVTLHLTAGFYLGRDVLYLSTDSSVDQIAALEAATYAPNLAAAPSAGNRDSSTSARESIIPVVNGPMGVNNPQRQGLRSAVSGEGDPLNIIREEPECSNPNDPAVCSALDYSPLWDVHPVAWTQAAIAAGQRQRVTSHETIIELFQEGLLVSAAPDGPVNPELGGLRAAGVVVNCPPIFVAPQ